MKKNIATMLQRVMPELFLKKMICRLLMKTMMMCQALFLKKMICRLLMVSQSLKFLALLKKLSNFELFN